MSITAEYMYTEEEAIRATEEVTKSMSSHFLVRLLIPLLARGQARKQFQQNPNANRKIVWRFDEEKVEDSTDGASSIRLTASVHRLWIHSRAAGRLTSIHWQTY